MSYNSVIKQIELNLSGKENCGSYDARLDWIEAQLGIAPVAPNLRWNVEARIQEILRRINSYVLKTVSGTLPLTLTNAVAETIVSLIQYGKCLQITNPTPSNPSLIFCNNGALSMLNLADMRETNLDIEYYINSSGASTSSAPNFYTLGFIPVKASTDYTMKVSEPINYFNILEYDSAHGFLKRTLWGSSGSQAGDTITFTTRSDTKYIRFGSNMNGNALTYADITAVTWMLTEGATAQNYVPNGQLSVVGNPEIISVNSETANANDLFSCGAYEDEQNIISGTISRKVGVYIFDGTENFTPSGIGPTGPKGWTTPIADKVRSKVGAICSHYPYSSATLSSAPNKSFITFASENIGFKDSAFTSAEDLKAFFAEQYAAGTPVIVVYPLASAVTERTEPQILHTEDGTNTITVTANVTGIKVEVTYCSSEE